VRAELGVRGEEDERVADELFEEELIMGLIGRTLPLGRWL
jgi:hypothetical protein